jgi:hypothetical protein
MLRNRPKRQPPCADDRTPPFLADKRDSQEGAPIDSQITFADEVVAAMENRLTEHRAMVGKLASRGDAGVRGAPTASAVPARTRTFCSHNFNCFLDASD